MTYMWTAVSMRTGRPIADLPGLEVDRVSRLLGTYTTATARLPIPTAPNDWVRATTPGAVAFVLLDDDMPVWGGYVQERERTQGDYVDLSLATWEAYLDRRYIRNAGFSFQPQTTIAQELVTRFAQSGTPLLAEATSSVTLRDRTYTGDADKTVLSGLQELSGVIGGPEFTVTWRALSNPLRFVPVFHVADMLGQRFITPSPEAVFTLPGNVISLSYRERFTSDSGANSVIAVSTAQGDIRPQSPEQTVDDGERPPFEYRFTPSTSITIIETLRLHAVAKLAGMQRGATSLKLAAAVQEAPRLGAGWNAGDDVGYVVDTPSLKTSGVTRAVGWELSLAEPQTVTPILVESL